MTAYAPVSGTSVPVPAGESTTWVLADDSVNHPDGSAYVADGDTDMTYRLGWPGGEASSAVRVVA
ncbi:MAG: hypothetical protein ABEH78_10180 [Haloferacaceae archaeon]